MTQRRKLEDYMKTIYMLQRRASVRGSDIAAALNVSRPTVSVSLKELAEEGYLERLSDHSVVLTAKGMKIAEEITERNTSIYDMLVKLGVSEDTAAADACNMEHAISSESYRALIGLAQGNSEPDMQ